MTSLSGLSFEQLSQLGISLFMTEQNAVLEIKNLAVEFSTPTGPLRAVEQLDLSIKEGETLALVGESGSGKSVTCLSIMGLLPDAGKIVQGSIRFKGKELQDLDSKERRRLRGSSMSMIFQEPMTSLNPVFKIGSQLAESVRTHSGLSKKGAMKRAAELLDLVQIPEAKRRLKNYPHELSGGMRQRVMIAMALSGDPELLIADEPTTALDVTVQAQIIDLLDSLKAELGMALLFVTHDLGVVASIADRVAVMYAGQLVEMADVRDLFDHPQMPYTTGLIASVPALSAEDGYSRLKTISGQSPSPRDKFSGCKFGPRCDFKIQPCEQDDIPLITTETRSVRCLRSTELKLS